MNQINDTCFDRVKEHSRNNLGNGTDELKIKRLEADLKIELPKQYRDFISKIGYAEIFDDEIFSIYEIPDEIPCAGLHWMNAKNELLKSGFIKFFSNDIDGVFYIHQTTGIVYLNSENTKYAESFCNFINKILDDSNA